MVAAAPPSDAASPAFPRLRAFADRCVSGGVISRPLPYFLFWGGPVLLAPLLLDFVWGELLGFLVVHYTLSIGVNLSHHRYFSHHSFAASRPVAFLIGLWGSLALQRGPLWWASHHRVHHRYCETEQDPHSPRRGFFRSHFGWTVEPAHKRIDWSYVKELARYPELYLLEGVQIIALPICAAGAWLAAGWPGVGVYLLAVCTSLNAEAAVNSLCHDRPDPDDPEPACQAKDVLWIALANGGDGFHGLHHERPRAARHATGRWEPDITYLVICLLERLRLVSKVAHPKG